MLLRAEFIPDDETEVYFKAADVLVLPYRHIYQSGVLFLGYSFGLPVLAADVGSLKDEIVEGKTGFIFRPEDPVDLARAIEQYFASDLYADLNNRRQEIRDYATERHSWEVVGQITMGVYARLASNSPPGANVDRDASNASLDSESSFVKTPQYDSGPHTSVDCPFLSICSKPQTPTMTAQQQALDAFSTEHLHADLKGRSVRGGLLTLTSQGAQFLMQSSRDGGAGATADPRRLSDSWPWSRPLRVWGRRLRISGSLRRPSSTRRSAIVKSARCFGSM